MKTILILAIIAFSSCIRNNTNIQDSVIVSVIDDRTDSILLHPGVSVLPALGLSENKNHAATFRYCEITDKALIPIINLTLPSGEITRNKNIRNEPLFREQEILNLYDSIRKLFNSSNTNTGYIGHSQCFKTIASELTMLTQHKSAKKYLLIYSNLFEHSPIWSLYSTGARQTLFNDPKQVLKLFEKTKLLPGNLSGIQVIFIYEPLDMKDDQTFNAIVTIYKTLIEKRGGTCRIQASNANFG